MNELKSTPRQSIDEPTSFNTIQQLSDENKTDKEKAKDGEWPLDPSRYFKWYRVKPKGELEFGSSLVRVRSWV